MKQWRLGVWDGIIETFIKHLFLLYDHCMRWGPKKEIFQHFTTWWWCVLLTQLWFLSLSRLSQLSALAVFSWSWYLQQSTVGVDLDKLLQSEVRYWTDLTFILSSIWISIIIVSYKLFYKIWLICIGCILILNGTLVSQCFFRVLNCLRVESAE